MITLTLVFGIIIFVIFTYKNYIKQYEGINKLPGPSTFQLIKELYFNASSKGIIAYLQSLTTIYGPIVKVWMKPFPPLIITNDMEYCNKLFKANDHFVTPSFGEVTFIETSITLNGNYEERMKDKQIITKTLNMKYIGEKLSIYDERYNKLLDIIRNNLEKPIYIEKEFHKIFIDVLVETFNHPNVEINKEDIQKYNKNKEDYFDLLMKKMNSIKYVGFLHKFSDNYKSMRKCHNEIMEFVWNWLEKFKGIDESLRDKSNLICAMIENGMPERRIVDNLNTLIEGGHETTIRPLSMALRNLGENLEIQQTLFNEVTNIIGTDIKEVTMDDINKMTYLHAFIKESIRLYMSVPFLDRITNYDMEIGGTKIPKNTQVFFDIPGILTSEKNYEDPLSFKPTRFLKENATSKSQKAFLGFGYGVKGCPGKFIAYTAMKLFIIKIIREFEIVHVDHKIEFMADLFFRSTNGIPVVFRKRLQ
ncbi:cytochrome P450 4C1-like [Onthophagus taurus]|uniref:cytochrome P450 4C1-like n=1 Tax=Onthophagus taurus TaxID=166361 RepID=UPI000C200336|nr:cytochrome P450 4C1-like [Onthophagus taurus]